MSRWSKNGQWEQSPLAACSLLFAAYLGRFLHFYKYLIQNL